MKAVFVSPVYRSGENKAERINRVLELICGNGGADIYLLPELWGTGFFSFEDYKNNAEDFYGETLSALSDMAKSKNAYIFTGSFIEKRCGSLYNTAAVLDGHGNVCGRYSKTHLFGREKEYLSRGDNVCVCDVGFARAGISICYDLRFPELYREMLDMGAEIFLNCSAWPASRAEHWELLNRARAVENQAFCLSCCARGEDNGTEFAAVSYAISPQGRIILQTSAECDTAEFDMAEVSSYRSSFPAIADK